MSFRDYSSFNEELYKNDICTVDKNISSIGKTPPNILKN